MLTGVSDSYSRSLVLAYTSGLLHTVTTPDSLVLTYGYTAATAGGNQLTSVGYNTSPATSQTYLYENTSFLFALTGITDEKGHRTATWGYDGYGRATMDCQGASPCAADSADYVQISYDDSTGNRTVTQPDGEQDTYKFTTLQGVPKVTEIDRAANGTVTASAPTLYKSRTVMNKTRFIVPALALAAPSSLGLDREAAAQLSTYSYTGPAFSISDCQGHVGPDYTCVDGNVTASITVSGIGYHAETDFVEFSMTSSGVGVSYGLSDCPNGSSFFETFPNGETPYASLQAMDTPSTHWFGQYV